MASSAQSASLSEGGASCRRLPTHTKHHPQSQHRDPGRGEPVDFFDPIHHHHLQMPEPCQRGAPNHHIHPLLLLFRPRTRPRIRDQHLLTDAECSVQHGASTNFRPCDAAPYCANASLSPSAWATFRHDATFLPATGNFDIILAIANTKKIPGCYVSRCIVGSRGGKIVSDARAGVTGEACTYVYLYWFMFIIVRPAQWQPRKNDPLDY